MLIDTNELRMAICNKHNRSFKLGVVRKGFRLNSIFYRIFYVLFDVKIFQHKYEKNKSSRKRFHEKNKVI